MKLLKNNPIIDTGLEMTLSYSVPSDAIVGILFNVMHQKDKHVGLQKLPVSNIPDDIRKMDPNLKTNRHTKSRVWMVLYRLEMVFCV